MFRDVTSLIINQCEPRRTKSAYGGHKVSASRAAQSSDARLLSIKHSFKLITLITKRYSKTTFIPIQTCTKLLELILLIIEDKGIEKWRE